MSKHVDLDALATLADKPLAEWLVAEGYIAPDAVDEAALDDLRAKLAAKIEAVEAEAAVAEKLEAAGNIPAIYSPQTGTPLRHVTGTLGAGKTYGEIQRIVKQALDDIANDRFRQVVILARHLDLAEQIEGDLRTAARLLGAEVAGAEPEHVAQLEAEILVYPGWAATTKVGDKVVPRCKFGDLAKPLFESGRSPARLCQSKTSTGEIVRCKYFDGCAVRRAHLGRDKPRIVIGVHSYLQHGFPAERGIRPDELLIDETPLDALLPEVKARVSVLHAALKALPNPGEDEDDGDAPKRSAKASVAAIRGNLASLPTEVDEGDTDAAERAREHARRLRMGKAYRRLEAALSGAAEGSGALHLADLPGLAELYELRELVKLREQRAAHRDIGVAPNPDEETRGSLAGRLDRLPYRDALALFDLILSAACTGNAILPGVKVYRGKSGGETVTGSYRVPIHETFGDVEAVTLLSSTMPPELMTPWFSSVDTEGEWTPPENDPADRAQCLLGTATRSMIDLNGDAKALTEQGEKIAGLIDELRRREGAKPVLLAGVKKVIEALEARLRTLEADGRPRAPITVESYTKLLGSNDYVEYGTYIAVGRTLPGYQEIRLQLEALVGGPVEPPPRNAQTGRIGYWEHEGVEKMTKHGERYQTRQPTHPDPVVAAYLRELAISPVVQSDRSRAQRRVGEAGLTRIVFNDMALPEVFDRVAHKMTQVLGDDIARVAERWGLVPEKSGRGIWQLMALLRGEDDPLGAGAERLRLRDKRREGDSAARRIAQERARLGEDSLAYLWAVLERRGQRSIRVPVLVRVEKVARRFPTSTEGLVRGDGIAAEVKELGWLPDGVTLSFTARHRPKAKTRGAA